MSPTIAKLVRDQEHMRKLFAPPESIAKLVRDQERMRKLFAPDALGIGKLLRQQEETRKLLTSSPWLESLRRAAEQFRNWDENEERLLDQLTPRGWLISPSSSLADLTALAALAEEQGIDAAETALLQELNPTRCRQIVEGLYRTPSFARWRGPLDQALGAHENGLFALSVPVWLLAFDGIARSELGGRSVFSVVRHRHGPATIKSGFGGGSGRLLHALVEVIAAVAEQIPRGDSSQPDRLRRHAVLHGRDPAYGTEKASVQGVLLLEVLELHLSRVTDADSGA